MLKLFLTIQTLILISFQTFSQTEWEYIGLDDPNVGDIFDIEIDDNGKIFAGTLFGPVYRSTDNGATWELINNGLPANAAIGEAIAIYQNQIYLTTNQGLYKSTNSGDYWFRIAQSIPFLDFDEVTVITNGYIFTSVFNMGTGGVFRSTDEGVTWEATNYTGFGALDMGINSNGIMFLGNATASWYGIQRSFNLGMTWEWIIPFISTSALEYLRDGSVLAGAIESPHNSAGIYKTTNNGDSWFNTNTFNNWNIQFFDFVLDTNDDIYLSVAGAQNGVYLSTNSGVSWEYRGLSNEDVNCLTIDSSGYVYAGTLTNGIFRTPGRTTPVELVSFTADVNEGDVELRWITATELNNSGFEILRFTQNDNEWKSIGFVPGYGTSTEKHFYTFTDENLRAGKYQYRLKQIDFDGTPNYSEVIKVEIDFTPKAFILYQNYPNPFNPSTIISYTIPVDGIVTLKVFDILGNEVRHLIDGEQKTGSYQVKFNAEGLSSGMYFCILNFRGINEEYYNSTMKMTIMK